jgi:hypothetical protein
MGDSNMNTDEVYEQWRRNRSQIDPPAGFSDRVMNSLGDHDSKTTPRVQGWTAARFVRVCVCTAATVAAVFRVVELLNLFAASRLDN